ncbi:biopolymer transporter ExbD [Flavitalea sp. BT771]|uniref:biopolymer transporter ExbD n=1 Tax=Flavitalea sp. BT771 TaxID=3063329 RepID=UPI0026E1F4A5|nr:biopolymer transporter ExbD [Flavitalea sp. BT771]MDO6433247.1 biopolymer transporter ExbD [Flavitalea sp. BT771]MDV6221477.1 biopolymer transporter ExbD [Flavitalea sp. BT771]
MPRAKIPRKSTNIDMTAMCDVAFLLLSFFILATKFKPPEALSVTTPSSVSSKVAPEKNVVLVTMDKEGKVYFSVSDGNVSEKKDIIDAINTAKNLGLSDQEKKNFSNNPTAYIGVPFTQLKSYLDKTPDEMKKISLPGIPVKDSTDNELVDWVRAAVGAFQGTKMALLVKGDNAAKYPSFQGVIIAFKKNDQMKFQMVTNPVPAPAGSELFKVQQTSGSKATE